MNIHSFVSRRPFTRTAPVRLHLPLPRPVTSRDAFRAGRISRAASCFRPRDTCTGCCCAPSTGATSEGTGDEPPDRLPDSRRAAENIHSAAEHLAAVHEGLQPEAAAFAAAASLLSSPTAVGLLRRLAAGFTAAVLAVSDGFQNRPNASALEVSS